MSDKLPEHATKRIYWHKDGFGWAFILVGYCPDTLEYFLAMYEEAKATFPALEMGDVTCGKVTKSPSIQGFTLITFNVKGPRQKYPEWEDYDGNIDFCY